MVAGHAVSHQPSVPHKPLAKGSDHSEPADSSEAATRHMSLRDMPGPLCGMPDGTTSNAQVATNSFAPAGKRQNKTPIFVSEVKDMRGFLTWIRASFQSGLSTQNKWDRLMLFPRTDDGFRATVSTLRSLDGSKGESFHTFSLPEERCERLLNKNLGR